MSSTPPVALCAAASLLAACEHYTAHPSPCFGRTGAPQVTRSALSFSTMGASLQETAKPDCTFEPLPRPE